MRRRLLASLYWQGPPACGRRVRRRRPSLCSNESLKGLYTVAVDGTFLPGGGSPFASVGLFHADGAGAITAFSDVISSVTPEGLSATIDRDISGFAAMAGATIAYTVDSSCRLQLGFEVQGPEGPFRVEFRGVLMNGGRERA